MQPKRSVTSLLALFSHCSTLHLSSDELSKQQQKGFGQIWSKACLRVSCWEQNVQNFCFVPKWVVLFTFIHFTCFVFTSSLLSAMVFAKTVFSFIWHWSNTHILKKKKRRVCVLNCVKDYLNNIKSASAKYAIQYNQRLWRSCVKSFNKSFTSTN